MCKPIYLVDFEPDEVTWSIIFTVNMKIHLFKQNRFFRVDPFSYALRFQPGNNDQEAINSEN
jgi:hypothetical protein